MAALLSAEANWSRVDNTEHQEVAPHPPGLLYEMLPPLSFSMHRRPTHPWRQEAKANLLTRGDQSLERNLGLGSIPFSGPLLLLDWGLGAEKKVSLMAWLELPYGGTIWNPKVKTHQFHGSACFALLSVS